MNAQPPLPIAPVAGAVSIGEVVALVENGDGGRVFLLGELVYAWSAGDVPLRRLAAVQLVANKAARVGDVATAFGVDNGTLWRWGQQLSATGVGGLVPDKRGPKGAHRLTPEVVADITARRANGASYRAIATAIGVSYTSVRRVCTPAATPPADDDSDHDDDHDTGRDSDATATTEDTDAAGDELPVLPPPADRDAERAAARWGKLTHAEPVFTPPGGCPWPGCCWRSPPWRPPPCCPVPQQFSGVYAMGSTGWTLSLIHISEPTRQAEISYAVFCLKKKTKAVNHSIGSQTHLESKLQSDADSRHL